MNWTSFKVVLISSKNKVDLLVTGQLADTPTCCQSSRRLVNSRTSQRAEMFDLKFWVYNSSEVLFRTDYTIYTLPIFDRVRVRVRVNVQIKYSNSIVFKNSLLVSYPIRDLTDRKLVCWRVVLFKRFESCFCSSNWSHGSRLFTGLLCSSVLWFSSIFSVLVIPKCGRLSWPALVNF